MKRYLIAVKIEKQTKMFPNSALPEIALIVEFLMDHKHLMILTIMRQQQKKLKFMFYAQCIVVTFW